MQIIYCYIEDDINIQNQGINLGSPFIFSTAQTEKGYKIIREPNPSYVKDLFKRKSQGRIDNITAIVGENGSGKTNMINHLINGLEDSPFTNLGFLLFLKNDEEIVLDNQTGKEITANFKLTKARDSGKYAGIYYNPIYDFQDHYRVTETQIIDVSSNTLMYYDYYDDQFFNKQLDMIQLHKFKNVSRQVRFLVSQQRAQKIREYISIPRRIDTVFIDPHLSHDGEGVDNVSYDFRPFYKKGVDLWRRDKGNIHESRHVAEQTSKRRRKNDPFEKQLVYMDILLYIWKFIFFTQERNNSTLEEGHLNQLEDDDPNLTKLSFEAFIRTFLNDQNDIFNASTILGFIDTIKQIMEKAQETSGENNGYVSFSCNLNQSELLLDAYDLMTARLSSLLRGKTTNTLMTFNWRNMSSGERAFLDLFARVNHAVQIIDRKVERSNHFKTPEYLYIFLDEGEVGFHLQWQKEYINIITNILPRIIRFKNVEKQLSIQIIFTTHSPISLSDIPRYNTVYLTRNEKGEMHVISEKDSPKYSFGASVHEIMYDAFYLKDGFTGNFSREVINEVFRWLNNEKVKDLSETYVKKVIGLVDDPILRIKMEESYAKKMGLNVEEETLAVKIQLMQKRLSEIRSQQNDQNK